MKKLIISLLVLFACGLLLFIFVLPIDDNLDCFTKDQIIIIESNSLQSKEYRLVIKISGSHDKVVMISLYPKNVVFDGCGRANQQTIKEAVADEKQQIDKISIGKNAIRLRYIETNNPIDFTNISVVWE